MFIVNGQEFKTAPPSAAIWVRICKNHPKLQYSPIQLYAYVTRQRENYRSEYCEELPLPFSPIPQSSVEVESPTCSSEDDTDDLAEDFTITINGNQFGKLVERKIRDVGSNDSY